MTSKQAFFEKKKWKRIHMCGYIRVFFAHSHAEWAQLFFNFLVLLFLVNSSLHSFCHVHYILRSFFFFSCLALLCASVLYFIFRYHTWRNFLRSPIFADFFFFFRCVFSSNFTFCPASHSWSSSLRFMYVYSYVNT